MPRGRARGIIYKMQYTRNALAMRESGDDTRTFVRGAKYNPDPYICCAAPAANSQGSATATERNMHLMFAIYHCTSARTTPKNPLTARASHMHISTILMHSVAASIIPHRECICVCVCSTFSCTYMIPQKKPRAETHAIVRKCLVRARAMANQTNKLYRNSAERERTHSINIPMRSRFTRARVAAHKVISVS